MAVKTRIAANVEPEQADALRKLADKLDRPQQRLVREAIGDLLRKYQKKTKKIRS